MFFSSNNWKYFKKTFVYLRKYRWLCTLVVTTAMLGSIFEGFGISTIIPLFQGLMGNKINFPYSDYFEKYLVGIGSSELIIYFALFILFSVVLKGIFSYLNIISVNRTSNNIRRDLQVDLFGKIVDSGLKFFNSIRAGHLIGSISVYSENIAGFIFSFLNFSIIIARILVYTVLLFLISWKFTLLMIIVGLFILPLVIFILNKIRKVGFDISRNVSSLHFRMMEMFNNINLMKIFGTEDFEKNRFGKVSREMANNNFRGSAFSNILRPFSETIITTTVILGCIYAIIFIKTDFSKFIPFIIAYLYIFSSFYKQISDATLLLSGMYMAFEPFQAYEKILLEAKGAVLIDGDKKIVDFKEKIEFKNVNFGYSEERPVLHGINLSIEKGKFLAIVGPTGVGKTTIANLISGLYLPNSGGIFVDGINLSELNLHCWRQKIGYVSQDIMIFNDSVINNITYGLPEAKKEDVINAAKAANIHEFISQLPNGYNTVLGERGTKLSGGQRQRLSIARAIIRNPQILILDEATSSLDMQVEKDIQEELGHLFINQTVIAIAHRLSTIAKADKIVVLYDGKIIEEGKQQELLQKNGFYKNLYELLKVS